MSSTSLELMLVLVSARSEAWESEKRLMVDGVTYLGYLGWVPS